MTRGIKCKHKHKQRAEKIFCTRKIFTALKQSTEIHQQHNSDGKNAVYHVELLFNSKHSKP